MRSRFMLVTFVLAAAAWLTGCESFNPFSSGPECTPYVASSEPSSPPATVGTAKQIVPTDVCDSSVKIENDKAVCADPAKAYSITAGGNNDLSGNLVTMTVETTYTRIDWDAKSLPHAIIVGDQWGYFNGPNPEDVDTRITASLLYPDEWIGGIPSPIRVCNR